MKTSNKLLIGLAALLFVIPLSAMIYDSRNYVDAKDFKDVVRKPKTFDEALKGNFAQTLTAYNAIKMADGKGMQFTFSFIQDAKYGVKLKDDFKGLLEFKNGANALEITVVGTPQLNQTIEIQLYGPSIEAVSVNNAKRLRIGGDFTSMEIAASNIGSFNLQDRTLEQLILNADKVEEVNLSYLKVNNLVATLNETDFNSYTSNYQSLTLKTSGKSNVSFGDDNSETKESLGTVSLTTLGTGKVSFGKNIQLNTISGNLSDGTNVEMPAAYLKQMFVK